MTGRAQLFRAALVLVAALVLQITVLSDLRVVGGLGDLMLAMTVAAGLTGGADRGATWGFATGVLYDLVLDTPFGLSALTYALVGYAVGLAGSALLRTSGWWPVGLAAAAGLVHAYDGEFLHFVGGGVAVFDCDGDGRQDLYLAGGEEPAALFRNRSPVGGALAFEPVPSLPSALDTPAMAVFSEVIIAVACVTVPIVAVVPTPAPRAAPPRERS